MLALTRRAVVAAVVALAGLGATALPAHAETGWNISFSSAPYSSLSDVTATGPDDAWAVGSTSGGGDSRRLSHWNGAQWQELTPPPPPQGVRTPAYRFVGASSPQDVWTLGYDSSGDAFAQHWNGTSWGQDVSTFGSAVHLTDIADIGPDDTWVVGSDDAHATPFADHYDGNGWTRQTLPAALHNITAISATSGTNVWISGTANDGSLLALQWNGSTWRSETLPVPKQPKGVWAFTSDILAVGTDDVWVSAGLTRGLGIMPGPLLWHRTGSAAFGLTDIQAPADTIDEMVSDGTGGLWMTSRDVPPSANLMHYSGGSNAIEPAPVQPGTTSDIRDLTEIPGTGSLWAAGLLFRSDDTAQATMYRYDP